MLARLAVAVAALLTIAMVALVVLPASAFAAVATEQNIAGLPAESRRALPVEIAPAPDKKLYVALGDSFSSGEGAPAHVYVKGGLLGFVPQRYKVFLGDPGSEGYGCHRSPHAYPVSVATGLGPGWSLDLRACSGATFDDLDGRQNGEPPQIDAFSVHRQQADLITMTMGGNDLNFASIVKACVVEAGLFSVVGADCRTRESDFVSGIGELRAQLSHRYSLLQGNLAESGRLIVLGYPRPFPSVPPDGCGAGVGAGKVSQENMLWVNSVAKRLSATIRTAAIDVGATYIDVTGLYNTAVQTPGHLRHDACIDSNDQRWVNRTILNGSHDPKARNWSWHPKVAAHNEMAKLVTACVHNPLVCDSPERRRDVPSQPDAPPRPCFGNCSDLTITDPWTNIRTGRLARDGAGMTGTLFEALYLSECDRSVGGPGAGTILNRIDTHDFTGDGLKEAVLSLECEPSTSSWPEHVVVLDGAAGPRDATVLDVELTNGKLVGTANRPATLLHNLEFAFDGDTVILSGDARSYAIPSADPADYSYRQELTWRDGQWAAGPVGLARQPTSLEPSGHSVLAPDAYPPVNIDPVHDVGELRAVEMTGGVPTLVFDRVSFHFCTDSESLQAEGSTRCLPYELTNDNPMTRRYVLAPDAAIFIQDWETGTPSEIPSDLEGLRSRIRTHPNSIYAIQVDSQDRVMAVTEAYLP